ncbi:leucine-rich repeat domain-containing protein [Ralstonia pseudosolanacearum]|uniref:leucine-rich repeat domain-containing protein n=1 Tax=Ralstonia pseudosolanacearum TaxID=1310165 RepID=UPI001D00EFB8|nr:type III effector [Ralstonia pseudosolanacearum]MDC6295261.1 type III effector [Ralstonia pseudosolanacearum]MDD7791940.1 type III effector [Ralstonia pseudosolanacearum]MDN3367213.1 type III effector [Ralstonia pseudosolanacearum]
MATPPRAPQAQGRTGLDGWRDEMMNNFRQRGLDDLATQARVHSELKRAAGYMKNLQQKGGKELLLTSLPIARLPDAVFNMTQLKAIRTEHCDLHELSPALQNLRQLEALSLSGAGKLNALPHAVGQLPRLQELRLVDTGIQAMPPMWGASALKELTVSNTPLASLPDDLGALQKLAHLSLSGTQLRELPASAGNMSALQTLSLRDNKKLSGLPQSLGNLSGLESLTLAGNHIRELPSMREAHSLQELTVDEPSLAKLPPDFGTRGTLGRLAHLSLSNTKLRELPADLGNLSGLKTLSLQGNQRLEALPQSFGKLSGLEMLSLVGNRIQSLPSMDGVSALKKLKIDDASLASLPRDFGAQHKMLTNLSLSNTQLRTLPSSIDKLSHLQELKLNDNAKLNTLPDSLTKMKRLKKLDLSGCKRLESLPQSIGKLATLQELDLRNCTRLTFAALPHSVRFPRDGLRIHLPDHLKAEVQAERLKANPRAQVLLGDLERKGELMDDAIFDSRPQLNEGEVISLAYHLKDANDRKPLVQQKAERKGARESDSPLMRQALANLFNVSTDVGEFERIQNAALSLPAILQRELADLMTAQEGQQLVQSIGEAAYGVRANAALQKELITLAHQIASDPVIREVRQRHGRSHLAEKLTPLVEPLWENARALAPMPSDLRKQLTSLLAVEPGRKLVSEISKEVYSKKHRDEILQDLMPTLAARIESDPRSQEAHRQLNREFSGISRQAQKAEHAMTMTAIVQDHWNGVLAEAKKQGKAPMVGPSGQH